MREIKFRAWVNSWKNVTQKIMGSVESICWDKHNPQIQVYDPCTYEYHYYRYHDCVLMQFTGLKDKNGKEIYEGDIVTGNLIKYSPLATMGQIVFDEYWCSFANKNDAGNTLLREINDIEIIGNIYENKDLLK